jgi:uncharacterized protein (DUF697 family)
MAAGLLSSIKAFAQKYLSKELVILGLKKYAPQITAKTIAKYIPIIGQITAVAASFGLTVYYGNIMIDECEEKAQEVLDVFTNSMV